MGEECFPRGTSWRQGTFIVGLLSGEWDVDEGALVKGIGS